jgi:hypothetical protein
MAVKDFVEDGFNFGEVATLVSLYLEGAFNSAWWPGILKSLTESECPETYIPLQGVALGKDKRQCKTPTLVWRHKLSKAAPKGHGVALDCGTYSTTPS